MRSINKIKVVCLSAMTLFSTSCKKSPAAEGGKVKFITEDGLMYRTKVAIQSAEQTIDLLQLIRDSANAEGVAQPITVVLTLDSSIITAAGTGHKIFPQSFYVIDEPASVSGNQWTINFKPGQTAKTIKLKIKNAAAINFLNRYALPFAITVIQGNSKISESEKKIIAVISGTNKYTGRYRVTGSLTDTLSPSATNVQPYWDAELLGIGQDSVVLFALGNWQDFVHPFQTGAAVSTYTQFSPTVIFNTTTDSVKKVINYWGNPASNTRSALIDTGASWFNSVTHNITIKYKMLQPSAMPSGNARVRFNEVWKYLGP